MGEQIELVGVRNEVEARVDAYQDQLSARAEKYPELVAKMSRLMGPEIAKKLAEME